MVQRNSVIAVADSRSRLPGDPTLIRFEGLACFSPSLVGHCSDCKSPPFQFLGDRHLRLLILLEPADRPGRDVFRVGEGRNTRFDQMDNVLE